VPGIEEIQATKAEVEPHLFAQGWTKDESDFAPTRPNPLDGGPRNIRVRYKHPETGLYYSFQDAWRIVTCHEPIRPGLAPSPGSIAALNAGCTCARIDNHYGRGYGGDSETYGFVRDGTCPVHTP